MPRRIVIADRHPVSLRGVREVLEQYKVGAVIGETTDTLALWRLCCELRPSVVVTDLLPPVEGKNLIKGLTETCADAKVLTFSDRSEEIYGPLVLQYGARGFVSKTAAPEALSQAVERVIADKMYVSEALQEQIISTLGPSSTRKQGASVLSALTPRELDIIRLVGRGWSSREMAEELGISSKTVETHRERLKEKLGLSSTNALIVAAVTWLHEGVV